MSKFTPLQKVLLKKYSCDIEKVRLFQRLREHKDVAISDERLIWCMYAKKTFEKSLKSAILYQKILEQYEVDSIVFNDELYKKSPYFQKLIDSESFFVGDCVTKDGYGCFLCDYGNWTPIKKKDEVKFIMGAFIVMFESLIRKRPENATNGIIFLADLGNFGWKNFDFNLEKLGAVAFQSIPCRMKSCVMFDSPWYINLIIKLLKPFYSKKMMKRFVCCKRKDLQKYIDGENLIEQWGGGKGFDYRDWLDTDFGIKFCKTPKVFVSKMNKKRAVVKEEEEEEGEEDVVVDEVDDDDEEKKPTEEELREAMEKIKKLEEEATLE